MTKTKRVSVTVKLSEDDYEKLNSRSQSSGMAVAIVMKLLVAGYLDGEVEIENGEIKTAENLLEIPIEDTDYIDLHLKKLVEKMREKDYPNRVIREMIDQMIDKVRDYPKYNSRRDGYGEC